MLEGSVVTSVSGVATGTSGSTTDVATANAALPTSPALDKLIQRAGWIGRGTGSAPGVSFTSLFLAFLAGDDDVSLWVQEKANWIGPTVADVVRRWSRKADTNGRDEARVRAARDRTAAELAGELSATTSSAIRILLAARGIARRVGSAALAPHHVFAAYLYATPGHGDDLDAWKLDRETWASRFRCYVTTAFPAEAAGWRALHDEVFPREHSVGVDESLHWATVLAGDAGAATIDTETWFSAILRDGMNHVAENVASAQLVQLLGGSDAVQHLLAAPSADQNRDSTTRLPLSDDAASVLDRAMVFATITRRRRSKVRAKQLHVRHVLLAMFSDQRSLPALDVVRRAGRTTDGVLAQLCRWISGMPDSADDRELLRAILDEMGDDVLAGYDNDEASGDDLLGIGADVRALAAVLASTEVKPPLSVGVFGDWGSGKSFFMIKLRERIEQLAAAARAKPHARAWCCGQRGRVVQIEFNAWHYLDANLWSSLAVRVFDALSDEFNEEFARACFANLESLQERRAEITAEQHALEVAATTLDQELATQRDLRMNRQLALKDYAAGLAAEVVAEVAADPRVTAATAQLHVQGTAIHAELRRIDADLGTVAGSVRRWWQTLREPARFIALVLVLGAPIAVATLVAIVWHAETGASAGFAALLGALGVTGGVTQRAAARAKHLVGDALAQVDRIEAAARAKQSAEELRVEAQRNEIGTRISALEREQLAVTKRKVELEAQLGALGNGNKQSLKEFVLQRASSDDYRKQLGIVSAVHKDFKQLVRLLVPSESPPNVERIILYIDDLDRCPPARVVEVLQAIHVILSLPLFVVVVAVDSRWLLDSLKTYYRSQFSADAVVLDAARPQQYLEKIFQIPFTLRPMSSAGYDSLVGSLLDTHVDHAPEPAMHGDPGRRSARGSTAPVAPTPQRSSLARDDGRVHIDLAPRGLRLEPRELAYAKTLSALVTSPRAAKRFVNLYRIVRSTLDDIALDRLIQGDYKATQICLALVIGCPTFGAELFEQVLSRQLASHSDLVAWCERRAGGSATSEPRERAALRELSKRVAELTDWEAVDSAVRQVARFSFETGRVLGTYALDPVARIAAPPNAAPAPREGSTAPHGERRPGQPAKLEGSQDTRELER
jgi:hypothetical protein